MQARYYDPVIGRFYSNDPVDAISHLGNAEGIKGFNRYSYAVNNPYKYKDPDGRQVVPFVAYSPDPAGHKMVQDSNAIFLAGAATVALALVPDPTDLAMGVALARTANILGKAQKTMKGGKPTTHASTSQRVAEDMADSGEYSTVHLNQAVSTITDGAQKSKVRPDVAGVRLDNGKVDVVEVLSGNQTAAQMQNKIHTALGSKCGSVTCISQD
jgi:hypothetical protein